MMHFFVEAVGVLGFITNVWANLLLARKSETGWAVRLGANVLWLAYGLAIVSLANILSSVVFAWINVYGWRRWRRERLMPKACSDHYRQDCKFCNNIVRQCVCHIGTDKPTTKDGICGVCALQVIPPVDSARLCIFCGEHAHGFYGRLKIPKCLEHSTRDLAMPCRARGCLAPTNSLGTCTVHPNEGLLAAQYHRFHGLNATIEGCPCCFP